MSPSSPVDRSPLPSSHSLPEGMSGFFNDHPTMSAIYLLTQAIPVVGAVASVPVALFSAVMVIIKITQAIFQKIKDGTPFFRSTSDQRASVPLVGAASYAILFADNILNICTLGLLNSVIVWIVYNRGDLPPREL